MLLKKNQMADRLKTLPGSNQLSLVFIVFLFVGIILFQQLTGELRIFAMLIPAALLMLNFIATLILRKNFIHKPALLIFHIALCAIVSLTMLGQLTYLKGTLELSTQEEFNGQLENIQAGPWHDYQLDKLKFTNLGFTINYHEGVMRDKTLNRLLLGKKSANTKVIEIGDHVPMVFGHYRFYTSHNKGYAPVFKWSPKEGGAAQRGSVHLPAYPIHEYKQAKEWTLPTTNEKIWTMLVIEEDVIPENRDFEFRVPYKHHIIVRVGEQRYKLRMGEEIKLTSGTLRYESLSSWMGYSIDYDWTRAWLLIACLITLLSLSWHYFSRLKLISEQ